MSLLRTITLGLRTLLRRDVAERELDEELRHYVEMAAREKVRAGMAPEAAMRAARIEVGGVDVVKERVRTAGWEGAVDTLWRDVRYAARALRRSPGFALVAVASLALGIGANTAIYTLIDAVMVRALPVPHPDELVQITTGPADLEGVFSNPLWEQVRDRPTGLAAVAAFGEMRFNVAERGESRRIQGSLVSGGYFQLFGMRPALGRLFSAADDVRGCAPVAVLGHGFWRAEYGGRADVIGRRIALDGQAFEIVGVAGGTFTGPEVGQDVRVFVPVCAAPLVRGAGVLDERRDWWLRVMGRRDPGVSLAQLAARVAAVAPAAYAATAPPGESPERAAGRRTATFGVVPAPTGLSALRARYSRALVILMGAVALLLLIACANVANLLLARAAARQREVAIRRAIGAGRRRLVRQLLTESALLAALGAAGGLLLAHWATRALVALIAADPSDMALDLSANPRVLGFTLAVATVTAVLFGLVPAWRGTRVDPQAALKADGHGAVAGHARFTLGKALVAVQVALSLVLLAGAGLLVGSLRKLTALDPGFRAEGVLIVPTDLGRAHIAPEHLGQARRDLLAQVRAIPGVRAAATAEITPVSGAGWNGPVDVDGFTPNGKADRMAWFNEVSDGYFATMGTRLVAGREFDARDVAGAERTAIVNEALARHYFGTASAVGRQFRSPTEDPHGAPFTIVGVVETAKYAKLSEDPRRIVYLPAAQSAAPGASVTLLVRGERDAAALVPAVRAAIARAQPAALMAFVPLSRQIASSLRRERLLALLSGVFGGAALLLSVLGLYGVMSYAVARRRKEIGVRVALGAARGRVVRLVLGDVVRVVAVGLVVGAGGALAAGRLVKSFLFGLQPAEPRVLALAALALAGAALVAGWAPAWRAARLDPMAALRED